MAMNSAPDDADADVNNLGITNLSSGDLDSSRIAMQIAAQANINVIAWGETGIGKSAYIESVAMALGKPCHVVTLSVREPTDQAGMPNIAKDGEYTAFSPPRWAYEVHRDDGGIVFLDELNTCVQTVQNSALRVVNEGWAGDLKLPSTTSFVAACNPPGSNSAVYELTAAMANRWMHLLWPIDVNEWCSGMLSGWPAPAVHRIDPQWRRGIQNMRSIVVSFIKKNPTKLHVRPDNSALEGGPFPTGRAWDKAAISMAAAQSAGFGVKSRVARTMMEGWVGAPVTREFHNWMAKLDLPDPETFMQDPDRPPIPKRQDQIVVTLDAIASAALDQSYTRKEQLARHAAAWAVLGRVASAGKPDLTIPACRLLAAYYPEELQFPEALDKIEPLLNLANIDFAGGA